MAADSAYAAMRAQGVPVNAADLGDGAGEVAVYYYYSEEPWLLDPAGHGKPVRQRCTPARWKTSVAEMRCKEREAVFLPFGSPATQNACCVCVIRWRMFLRRKTTVHSAVCVWVPVCVTCWGDSLSLSCLAPIG